MLNEPFGVTLHGQAGGRVANLFAVARGLATQMGRDVTVEGNDVRVVVTPQMDDRQCQEAYERALRWREQQTATHGSQRRADDTLTSIEDNLRDIHNDLLYLTVALGAWQGAHRDADLHNIAAAANSLAIAARRIEKVAEEQAGRP